MWRGETSALLHRLAPDAAALPLRHVRGLPGAPTCRPGATDSAFATRVRTRCGGGVGPSPNVVLRPGYVPDTLAGLEDERFAFVLLDLDLYEPTIASLEFFYPRLAPGGYLVMHDYNNPESDWACKRAFDSFLADRPERVIELGDMWGSALIRRSADPVEDTAPSRQRRHSHLQPRSLSSSGRCARRSPRRARVEVVVSDDGSRDDTGAAA